MKNLKVSTLLMQVGKRLSWVVMGFGLVVFLIDGQNSELPTAILFSITIVMVIMIWLAIFIIIVVYSRLK